MRIARPLLLLPLLALACAKKPEESTPPPSSPPPSSPPPSSDRTPAVAKDDPLYNRVEGTSFENHCTSDSACVKSGCSSEVCSAEQVNSTCDSPEGGFPHGDGCGCLAGECVWYRGAPAKGHP